MNRMLPSRKMAASASRLAVLAAGIATAAAIALSPMTAKAWFAPSVGVVIAPPVVVGPPVVYAAPPPPAVVYTRPPYYYYVRHWVPAHWHGPYWVPGHWA
jgi:hypothetical protein